MKYTTIAWRPVQCEDGKVRYIHLEADLDDLLRWLGGKALKAATKQSREACGAVRAIIRNKKP